MAPITVTPVGRGVHVQRPAIGPRRSSSGGSTRARLPRRLPQNFGPSLREGLLNRSPTPTTDPPLSPAPFVNPLPLLAIGAAALLSQIWGYFNQRGVVQTGYTPNSAPFTGRYGYWRIDGEIGETNMNVRRCSDGVSIGNYAGVTNPSRTENYGYGFKIWDMAQSKRAICGSGGSTPGTPVGVSIEVSPGNYPNVPASQGGTWAGGANYTDPISIFFNILAVRFNNVLQPVPVIGPDPFTRVPVVPQPRPLVGRVVLPAAEPEAAPIAPPAPPEVLPIPWPDDPAVDPVPALVPSIAPLTPIVPALSPAPALPAAAPTTGGATAVSGEPGRAPTPTVTPVTTPVGQVNTGLGPIGGTGISPAPTLQGIADETGKIEKKLEALMNNPAKGSDLTDVLQLLTQLYQLLSSVYPAGQYEISSPCEKLPNGDPKPPQVVSWTGGIGSTGELKKKIDALAELIQLHKTLRQPICKQEKAQGQPVTVHFEEY